MTAEQKAVASRASELSEVAQEVLCGQKPIEELEESFDRLHLAVRNLGGSDVWTRED
jgi:hypothetical protein